MPKLATVASDNQHTWQLDPGWAHLCGLMVVVVALPSEPLPQLAVCVRPICARPTFRSLCRRLGRTRTERMHNLKVWWMVGRDTRFRTQPYRRVEVMGDPLRRARAKGSFFFATLLRGAVTLTQAELWALLCQQGAENSNAPTSNQFQAPIRQHHTLLPSYSFDIAILLKQSFDIPLTCVPRNPANEYLLRHLRSSGTSTISRKKNRQFTGASVCLYTRIRALYAGQSRHNTFTVEVWMIPETQLAYLM